MLFFISINVFFILFQVLFVYSVIIWEDPTFNGIEYPGWAIAIGWFLAAISVGMIPLVFVLTFFKMLFTGVSVTLLTIHMHKTFQCNK